MNSLHHTFVLWINTAVADSTGRAPLNYSDFGMNGRDSSSGDPQGVKAKPYTSSTAMAPTRRSGGGSEFIGSAHATPTEYAHDSPDHKNNGKNSMQRATDEACYMVAVAVVSPASPLPPKLKDAPPTYPPTHPPTHPGKSYAYSNRRKAGFSVCYCVRVVTHGQAAVGTEVSAY